MSGTMQSSEKIAEALKLLDEAAAEKKAELASLLTDRYGTLKSVILESEKAVGRAMVEGKTRAVEAGLHARDFGVEKAKQVDEHVHRNPWPYIGGGALVGLLFGYILGRKNDR
jgi:ElaB/YqjD/DUF883 family membrane-anchored ribosome-binding protein